MATAAKSATDAACIVLSLDPYDILVGARLGAFWPDKAVAFGKLMKQDGQREPIKVRANGPRAAKPWTLVAGHHRLEGAKLEGLRVDAIEVEGDETTLRHIEASENVERGSRSPIERACFVRAIADAAEARLKAQHGDLTPEQIKARARWDAVKVKAAGVERDETLNDAEADHAVANFAAAYQWQESTAKALGLSKRTIRDDLAMHRALVAPFPGLYRDLATHPIVGENASALQEIAAIVDIGNRRALIEALIATPDMTLAQAMEGLGLSQAGPVAAQGATKFMNNAAANIRRLSASQQRDFVPTLLEALKPSVLDLIVAEIAAMQKGGDA